MKSLQSRRTALAVVVSIASLALAASGAVGAAGPPLPEGLGDGEEEKKKEDERAGPALPEGLGKQKDEKDDGGGPALPSGLGKNADSPAAEPGTPALPSGLGGEKTEEKDQKPDEGEGGLPFELSGFWEARYGVRTRDAPMRDSTLEETRLQLKAEDYWEPLGVNALLKTDFLYDPVSHNYEMELEEGRSAIDLREAHVSFTPVSFMDMRVGRQIITWGTGDFLFLNDMFPKDWRSFFAGRSVEYLKAPSDAAKASFYSDLVKLDVAYTPSFDHDRFVDGHRFLYWSDRLGSQTARDVDPETPNSWWDDDELAMRLHRMVSGYELAGYYYRGFWKRPGGFSPVSGRATFPDLSVYGASIEGRLWEGIANAEVAYYDSTEDAGGDDPFVNNSQMRFLVGYDRDMTAFFPSVKDFTVGGQYYLEHMMDHDSYQDNLPPGFREQDENRHLVTLRLTKQYWNQNLQLSLFTFYSWSDDDAYVRPLVQYDVTDHWKVDLGGNLFMGDDRHTFFGQLEKNSNVYGALRYSF